MHTLKMTAAVLALLVLGRVGRLVARLPLCRVAKSREQQVILQGASLWCDW